MSNANTFGARLIRARVEKGISQSDLATACDVAPAQISRYEADKNQPRLHILHKLAAALDIDPDGLLVGAEDDATAATGASEITQFVARLPTPMHRNLKALASAASRSLNAEIVHRLAQTLGEDFAAEQPAAQPVLAEMLAQMRKQTDCMRELVELARAANPE